MKRRRKKHKWLLPLVFLLGIAVGLGGYYGYQRMRVEVAAKSMKEPVKRQAETPKKLEQEIQPTLYITGSSGTTVPNIDVLIKAISLAGNNPAKTGIKIMVDTAKDFKLQVTGKIEPGNLYPAIAIGLVKGTNDPILYEKALKKAVEYLADHYNVSSFNLLGYSSGGGAAMRYLVDYSSDPNLPKVAKFLSLDGEYNKNIPLQPGESLSEILANGPSMKSDYYLYYEQHYKAIDKNTEVALLMGDKLHQAINDNFVNFSDSFSIYNLFAKNGNPVERYTYQGPGGVVSHGSVWSYPEAQALIEKFFYQEK